MTGKKKRPVNAVNGNSTAQRIAISTVSISHASARRALNPSAPRVDPGFMALEVIGAGFGRTGTLSTKAGLELLGAGPCYHMREILQPRPGCNDGHLDAWHAFATGQASMDWEWLFRSYRSSVDHPVCLFYGELMEVFPDAVVLLNIRDPERWFQSWASLWNGVQTMRWLAPFSPRMRKALALIDALIMRPMGGRLDRDSHIESFRAHIQAVIDQVPPERLLVYDVKQGWEPLCEFLQRKVPDCEFPRLNESKGSTLLRLLRFWNSTRS